MFKPTKEATFSEKEVALFTALEMTELMKFFTPFQLYQSAVEKAFIYQLTGNHVDALRRVWKCHTETGNIKRLTPEWDSLITFQ